jgi:hypothetical protein
MVVSLLGLQRWCQQSGAAPARNGVAKTAEK